MNSLASLSNDFDYAAAREFLNTREVFRGIERKKIFDEATANCREIVLMISQIYNPQRIYQWGSLLHEEQFDENSDIDIAVEGLCSAEQFFEMFGLAEKLTRFTLDLVELEKVHPLHVESIKKNGKLVYEHR